MIVNNVKRRYQEGQPSFGAYVTLPSPAAVEVLGLAGLDFVRMDAYHASYNNETLENMVRTAYSYDITPWVRVRNDPWVIMSTLDLGFLALTIPNIGSAAAARAFVTAAHYPPLGDREMSRPLRLRNLSAPDYIEWSRENLLLSCQIEGREGIENYQEIVQVDGLDVVQTGRGDLSLALGVPGEEFHPKVVEMEERIVDAALAAGKQVSLLQSITAEGIERAQQWLTRGVRIMTLDSDYRVLLRAYQQAIAPLRP